MITAAIVARRLPCGVPLPRPPSFLAVASHPAALVPEMIHHSALDSPHGLNPATFTASSIHFRADRKIPVAPENQVVLSGKYPPGPKRP
jgi:hypothetical protein